MVAPPSACPIEGVGDEFVDAELPDVVLGPVDSVDVVLVAPGGADVAGTPVAAI
jgi:hypothetical protein